ncbi:MAG TPA: peptide ABC transporter substrate-binding protein [Acidimicrobiales bacterium]|nr:peptide ABC transporter substrate-binding protein [Acidimicrobiales bacterium]
MHLPRFRRTLAAVGTVAVVGLLLAGCGSASSSSRSGGGGSSSSAPTGPPKQGGTATYAEGPGDTPNFIFPIYPAADTTVYNIRHLQYLLWRPLVWAGTGERPGVNPRKSLFKSIDYSNGGRTVKVVLKDYRWSDGRPVSSRDVTFFMNLLEAEKAKFGNYIKGEFPDNVVSFKATGPHTVVFHLNGSYSRQWFTGDQLALVTPIPQHVWDKESTAGPVGNYDTTPAGAKKVYKFLLSQAKDEHSYATNPLWKVVDGPWHLTQFTTNGKAAFAPNPHYSGPDKPHLSKFVELPFSSASSEFNVLRSGHTIDVGYIPFSDVRQQRVVSSAGYRLYPWYDLGIDYIVYDFHSQKSGPLLRQLYVRQALQHLLNQPAIVKNVYHGYAKPTYGPIPLAPKNSLVSSVEKHNPYPYSIAAAKKLLAGHGWTVSGTGTDTCASPGTGPGHCGPGIAKGRHLTLDLLFSSGRQPIKRQASFLKSSAAKAGITVNLSAAPFNSVVSTVTGGNNWALGEYGGFSYSTVPTGNQLFLTGAALNSGHYSNPVDDRNIRATLHSNNPQSFVTYENHLAKRLPFLWVPTPAYQLTEVTAGLHGVAPQNAYLTLAPEDWYYTKG